MKYQKFEKIPNKYGGFVKLYQDARYHRIFTMGKPMHIENRLSIFRYMLSKTAYKKRIEYVKGFRFELERGCCVISSPEVLQKLNIKRGVFDEFIKYLVNFETIELETKKGIGSFVKFINYDKYQVRNARIPFDDHHYAAFVRNDLNQHKTDLEPTHNLHPYNIDIKEEKTDRKKELVSNNSLTSFENKVKNELLKIYNFLESDFEGKYKHFICEVPSKVSKNFTSDFKMICGELAELGFEAEADGELNDPPFLLNKYKDFLKTFEKFKGDFLTFSLFVTKFKEFYQKMDHIKKQDEFRAFEKNQIKTAEIELSEEIKQVNNEFHKHLKHCTPQRFYDTYSMHLLICKYKKQGDVIYLDIVFSTGEKRYHIQNTFYKYLDKALIAMSAKIGNIYIYADEPTKLIIQSNL